MHTHLMKTVHGIVWNQPAGTNKVCQSTWLKAMVVFAPNERPVVGRSFGAV